MISRTECAPRKIKIKKKQGEKEDSKSDNEQIYQFYRYYIHPCILRLKNDKDKMNYAIWLTKLDTDTSELRTNLIKVLFISLQDNRPFDIFLKPPPEDLSELNFEYETAMEIVLILQNSTNALYNNQIMPQEIKYKRYAAVSPDMCSYTTSKASRYLVQSFYVRSDFPLYTWYNPSSIMLPDNIDHNQWELYLNRFDILTEDKTKNKLQNTCEDIMKLDQVTREITTDFRWHPYSIMNTSNRPKRSIGFIEIDQDLANQPNNQQHIDETAFNIVHNKTLPGYKMLNPRIYSTIIMPDPNFVFNTTGVKITYKNISRILPMNIEKCQLDDNVSRTCPLKCCPEVNSIIEDKSTKNSSCNTSTEQLIPCSTIDSSSKTCPLKQRKCSSKISCKNDDKSTKDLSCNTTTEQLIPCSTIDNSSKTCPLKQRKCSSKISCKKENKSTDDSSCNISTGQQLSCSSIDESSTICPLKQRKCCSDICSINDDKSTKNPSYDNISTEQQLPFSTHDKTSKACPLNQRKCSSEINWTNDDEITKNAMNNTFTKQTCSTTTLQNSQCQNACINSTSHKQMNKETKGIKFNKTDHTCFNSLSNSTFMNETLQSTYNDKSNMSSKKQLTNSFCSNNQSLNCTNSKPLDLCNNNQSKVQNKCSKTLCPSNLSLNDSSNYDWTMDEKSLDQSRVQNCTNSKPLDVCNNNQSKAQNEYSKIAYPSNSSLNDSSNYDWTMTNDEKSFDQSRTPNSTSTHINNGRNSHRSYKERKCDHCSSIEPIHQNSQCSSNQISKCLGQNSQKVRKYNQSNRSQTQELYNNYTPNSSHLNSSQNEPSKTKNIALNNGRNNLNSQSKCKPRSVSVPCHYNRTHQNIKHKEGKQYCENQNESCSDHLQCGRNNNLNPPNKNTKKSAINYSDRNEQISKCRFDDNWDPDVGNYSEFNGNNLLTSEKKNHLTKRGNHLSNNQNISLDNNSNYSDESVEIGFNGSHSVNSESFTTNTSYSSSIQQRPYYNHSEQTKTEHFRPFIPVVDGYNKSSNQVDGDCNRIKEPIDISEDSMNSGIRRAFNNSSQNSNVNFPILDQGHTNLQDYSIMDISSEWEDNDSLNSPRKHTDDMSCCEDSDLNHEFQDIRNTSMPNDRSYSDSNIMSMDEDDYSNIKNTMTSLNNSYGQLYNRNNTC